VGFIDNALPEQAYELIQHALPGRKVSKRSDCLFFAAAAEGALLRGGWRFVAGGAMTPDCVATGWGLTVSPRDQRYYVTASTGVDPDDGSYCGHCWVQTTSAVEMTVVDVMTGYCGFRHSLEPFSVYHAVPKLTRSVRAHHAEELKRVRKAARSNEEWCRTVALAARRATQEMAA
jgi:hypothetical protein